MDWFLYDIGLRHERVKRSLLSDWFGHVFRPEYKCKVSSYLDDHS